MAGECNSNQQDIYVSKPFKRSPILWRMVFLMFATIFGIYICFICLKEIRTFPIPKKFVIGTTSKTNQKCGNSTILSQDGLYLHYPIPKAYSRGECMCTPVRFFVILSMQRSGSGWFETFMNSHLNVSSNGEIFSVKERRANVSAIIDTLDQVYNLDWISSALKNECSAAVGFKWMLNQGVLMHHEEIVDYFNKKGVSVIFLLRKNLLKRLISVLANAYDRDAKQINGTHKSHVHSKPEAEILARYKPTIELNSLIPNLKRSEDMVNNALDYFNSTRHVIIYYEDIINNQMKLIDVQRFLGLPTMKLKSLQVKIHTKPLSEQIDNWFDVYNMLNGTKYNIFLEHANPPT